ncbi:MAG: hypothetical protein ACYTGC_20680, partial [Planctomycetota bacterium]
TALRLSSLPPGAPGFGTGIPCRRARSAIFSTRLIVPTISRISAFEYQRLTIGELLGRRVTDLLALAAWLLGAIAFMFLTARHLDRRGILWSGPPSVSSCATSGARRCACSCSCWFSGQGAS